MDWERVPVLGDVFATAGADLSTYYRAVPVRHESGRLVVLMANPRDFLSREDLETLTGYSITAIAAPEQQILRIVRRVAEPPT
jgi:hypothetical protein